MGIFYIKLLILTSLFILAVTITYIDVCLTWGKEVGYSKTVRYLIAYMPILLLIILVSLFIYFNLMYKPVHIKNSVALDVIINMSTLADYAFAQFSSYQLYHASRYFFWYFPLVGWIYTVIDALEDETVDNSKSALVIGTIIVLYGVAFTQIFIEGVAIYYAADRVADFLIEDDVQELIEEIVKEVLAEERFNDAAYKMNFVN
jgi:hypothetical protein